MSPKGGEHLHHGLYLKATGFTAREPLVKPEVVVLLLSAFGLSEWESLTSSTFPPSPDPFDQLCNGL